MSRPTVRELWALPELALVPALLGAIDGLLASLHAQHGTLDDDWQPGDPTTLRDARALTQDLLRARSAVCHYARAVRRALRRPAISDEPNPF